MLRRIWNYISNNALIAGLLLLLVGSGSLWALVKPVGEWLSGDSHIMRGVLMLLVLLLLIALAVVYRLATKLRRGDAPEAQDLAAEPSPRPEPQLPADFDPNERQLAVLAGAFQQHPLSVDLTAAQIALREYSTLHDATQAHAERVLSELCAVNAMTLSDAEFSEYNLTRAGLDYCHALDERRRRE